VSNIKTIKYTDIFLGPVEMKTDTPISDSAYFSQDSTMYSLSEEMKRMERELNAANERIRRLEDVLHTSWYLIANVNWDKLDPELKEICYSWRDNDLRPVLKEMVQRKNKEAKP